jgi:general secretion pathway protein D
MLELEVLEVSRDRLLQLGITPPGNVGLTLLSPNAKLSDLAKIRADNTTATIDSAGIKALGTDSDFDILASPRVRVINREKAKILIGNKVPTITSTLIPGVSGTSTAETISYIDVGLKLEIEPTIYLNSDVAIRVSLEVSSIVDKLVSKQGSVAYTVGNRNASTVLRLKDGENQILAGLINSETDRTINKFPGLGDLPLLGHLFKSQSNDDKKTEILLSITPRLVRNLQRQEASLSEFMGGTDNSLRARPDFKVSTIEQTSFNLAAPVAPVLEAPKAADAPSMPAVVKQSPVQQTTVPSASVLRAQSTAPVAPPPPMPPAKASAPIIAVPDRAVTQVVVQNPIEEKTATTILEKPLVDKSNKKKVDVQDKVITNKKNENKKPLLIDKVSPETLDFIDKVLKQNESK